MVVKEANLYKFKTTQLVKSFEFLSLGFHVSTNLVQKMYTDFVPFTITTIHKMVDKQAWWFQKLNDRESVQN